MDYKDISIDTYLEVLATIKEYEGPELDLHVSLIGIIFGMTDDEVLDLPLDKFQEYETEIAFLYKKPKITGKIPNTIVLNGRKYNVCKDEKKLLTSQFVDYQSYIALDDPDTHLAQVLSVFLIPEGEKYGKYEIESVIEEIGKYLNVQTALDLCFFLRKRSIKSTRRSLQRLVMRTRAMRITHRKNQQMVEKMKEIEEKLGIMLEALRASEDGFSSLTK